MAKARSATLSGREARILELVRRGMPDAEIAVRLGTGVEEVKARIGSLQERLGAAGRGDLADWSPSPPSDPESLNVAASAGATPGPISRRARPWLLLALSVAAGFAAGFGVEALRLHGSADVAPPEPAPAAAPSSPSPASTPSPTPASAALELPWATFEEPVAFPEHTVIIATERCWQCGGAARAVVRYWRNSGEVHKTEVFRPETVSSRSGSGIWSYGMTPDGARMVVGICVSWSCDWHDQGTTFQTSVALYESRDTGATWEPLGEVSADLSIAAVSMDRLILRRSTRGRWAEWSELLDWPSLTAVNLPEAVADSSEPAAFPVGATEWAWSGTEGALFTPGGERILPGVTVTNVIPARSGYALSLGSEDGGPAVVFADRLWGVGNGFRVPSNVLRLAAALPDGTLLGNSEVPAGAAASGEVEWRPVLIAPTGTVAPLTGPDDFSDASVEAATTGPVVEVQTPASCAEARSEPGRGDLVDCVGHLMLLTRRSLPARIDDGGERWLPVVTVDGAPAWVRSATVLE